MTSSLYGKGIWVLYRSQRDSSYSVKRNINKQVDRTTYHSRKTNPVTPDSHQGSGCRSRSDLYKIFTLRVWSGVNDLIFDT